jgi:transposase
LPREFAPWKTVYHYFRLWRLAGLWDRIHDQLRDALAVAAATAVAVSIRALFVERWHRTARKKEK